MSGFDTVVMVDWSARSAPSPAKPTKDAIFMGVSRRGREIVSYHRTRMAAMRALTGLLDGEVRADRRVLVGFDFPFGYPKGFAEVVVGSSDPLDLWTWMARVIEDDDRNRNNRWEVARRLNMMFPGIGPFWGCPAAVASDLLPAKGSARHGHGMDERREVERRLPRAQSCWKLFTTGSVGSQVLMGLPHVQALRRRYGTDLSVSPFEGTDTPIVLAEIYPGLIDAAVKARVGAGEILDAEQVRLVARAFSRLEAGALNAMLQDGNREEGWILGLGHEDALIAGLD